MRIGCDLDGVLVCFNAAYVKRIIDVTGEDRVVRNTQGPCDGMRISQAVQMPHAYPNTWDYPEDTAGYTSAQILAVWNSIRNDVTFWQNLDPTNDAMRVLPVLDDLRHIGHEIVFISDRKGMRAKHQAEAWLQQYGIQIPTVILTSNKAIALRLLCVDAYIDDKLEHVNACCHDGFARVYIAVRPWNRETSVHADARYVTSVEDMLIREGLWPNMR